METQTARLRVLCRALHFTVIGGGESHEEQSALSTSSSESTRNDCHVCQEQQDVFKMLKNNQKGPRITYWQAKLDLGVSWALQLSLSNYKDYSEKFEEAYNTLCRVGCHMLNGILHLVTHSKVWLETHSIQNDIWSNQITNKNDYLLDRKSVPEKAREGGVVFFAGQGFSGGESCSTQRTDICQDLLRSSNLKVIRIQRKQEEMASISRVFLGCGIAPTRWNRQHGPSQQHRQDTIEI